MKKLSCFLGLICIATTSLATTAEIESLRSKVQNSNVELTASDKAVISSFWSDSLDQMLFTESSQEHVQIRKELARQKGTEHLSYYAVAYVDEAAGAIEIAFKDAQRMEDIQRRKTTERNLMILVAELESPALSSLALQHFGSEDDVIRYWAFKAVTSSAVIQQLTSDVTADEKTAQAVLAAIKQQLPREMQAEILKTAIRFCMVLDEPMAREVLVMVADRRVKAYQDWTVQDEALDATLLTALGNIAMLESNGKVFGQKFAELYAAVIQRYLKGGNALNKDQIEQLLTVIAETDQNVLSKTMGLKTGIFQALKRKSGLEREYETLFGDRLRPGLLAEKFKFDYGKDASGKSITAPPELGPMPEKSTG